MSCTPQPYPNTRPRTEAERASDPGGQAFVAEWLAHVAAGRIGTKPETPEEIRAIVLANERLICGDGRLGIW